LDHTGSTSWRSDWFPLDAGPDSKLTDPDSKGWYMPLEPESQNYLEEYSSTQPAILGGQLYFATFMQEKVEKTGDDKCVDEKIRGKTRLYVLEMDTGAGGRWNENAKYIEIDGAKIVGFTHSTEGKNETLEVTFDVFDKDVFEASVAGIMGEKGVSRASGLVNTLTFQISGGGGKLDLPPGASVIDYWLKR
jgi:hypothetical protein